ncbi:transmembrane and immunoglobulin domain-containing protein 1-like [Xyrauchen texanus]|uniref:transmembrane and immunoglobulin domain-containing protein 1-like n=1 Tax=Xyrauchen texanus TaxID=154827 RepID=UPI0022422C01|nr:transmembrane and immunoglobulin domain-containing protein 1-like [Xyrauchen texanus]
MLLFSRKKYLHRHVDFSYQRLFGCLLRNMFSSSAFLYLYILIANDVLSDNSDELKTVLEGDSVTLHTNITEVKRDDLIMWRFGPRNIRIAQLIKSDQINFISVSNDEIFRDKLQLNNRTGSLTIKNITITHTGLYQLEIINNGGTSVKRFSITVYAPLPVPAITSNCSSSSERSSRSKCVLVCSVENVTHVTLSWYKGNSLLSSISVSDLNNSLSQEVEYQENNIYSCVINNPIRNQTKHLNINDVCQPGSVSCEKMHGLTVLEAEATETRPHPPRLCNCATMKN